jgi:signal transduction histidine kinase
VSAPSTDDFPLPPALRWLGYAAFWLAVGLILALAELQHYLRSGGLHPWEPFLWELSSAASTALLTLAIFSAHRRLFDGGHGVPARIAGHLAGAVLYVLAHSALMYAMRAVVYASMDVAYHPGHWLYILGYEGAKDLVSYVLIVAVCHGMLLVMRDRRQRADVARLNDELAAARIARLQEQIQPHVLFNTLNLVSSVMYEDVERADRILSELAELLRLSLEAGRSPQHSLGDEMRLVTPFLSIMRQRFAGRLDAQVQVSDEALRCQIPSLLLMAPIENAAKHGVARTDQPVQLRIAAQVEAGVLSLSVSDSAGQVSRDSRPGGIGLNNTRERLAALHGDAASVSLAREDDATVFRIRMPAKVAA